MPKYFLNFCQIWSHIPIHIVARSLLHTHYPSLPVFMLPSLCLLLGSLLLHLQPLNHLDLFQNLVMS